MTSHLHRAHELLDEARDSIMPSSATGDHRQVLLLEAAVEALLHIGQRLDNPAPVRGAVITQRSEDWPSGDGM